MKICCRCPPPLGFIGPGGRVDERVVSDFGECLFLALGESIDFALGDRFVLILEETAE